MIFCYYLEFMKVNKESLGLGLLITTKIQFKDVILHIFGAFLIIFWTFCRPNDLS